MQANAKANFPVLHSRLCRLLDEKWFQEPHATGYLYPIPPCVRIVVTSDKFFSANFILGAEEVDMQYSDMLKNKM
ncbi:MAG: hypothetical protein ABIJ52_05045, partial [Pseudomonadota bacterium]